MHCRPSPAQRNIPLSLINLTKRSDGNANEDLIHRFSLRRMAGYDQALIQVPAPAFEPNSVALSNPVFGNRSHSVHVVIPASVVSF